ncbi:PQQ-like beta-propeller repeat protein [Dactylosporangium roseum]|uniref:PQQ-like beta-propeller repeat protein n=1 Tax=Dactylosporangium roseum TaxID=47989 RepID=A0ABY5Z2S6_9ACTN|nr:PQQ-like beta-propeller repeat protein [Dactylosporangium roseum]UWZ35187.1 PQQ-like beta-propeller repeat protein [Dactylosporangium roseum]
MLLVGIVPQAAAPPAPSPVGSVRTATADASWRQDGGDPGRSGHQPVTRDLDAAAATRLERRWTAPATRADEQIGGAVVVDGTLFRSSGGPTGQIRRYDAITGHDLGAIVDVPGRRFGQLAVVDGTVIVESADIVPFDAPGYGAVPAGRHLSAYTSSGETRWELVLADAVSGGFTIGGGLVVRSAGATLSAHRLTDGVQVWTAPLGGEPGYHPPVLDGGLVLQAVEDGPALLAFDVATGALAWQRTTGGAELVARSGTVYTLGPAGVCAYSVTDGTQRWCDTTTVERPSRATVSDEALFVVGGTGDLAAFGVADGTVRWRSGYGLGWETSTSYWAPVNGGGVVYLMAYHFDVRDGDPRHRTELVAADTRTGALVTRLDLDFSALHGAEPLLLSGDHVYFAALERLFALAPDPR